MQDSSTSPEDRRANADELDARLRANVTKLVNGLNSWPLAERRAFVAQWIEKLESENSPAAKELAKSLTRVWMGR